MLTRINRHIGGLKVSYYKSLSGWIEIEREYSEKRIDVEYFELDELIENLSIIRDKKKEKEKGK